MLGFCPGNTSVSVVMESLALGYVSNSRFRVERCSIASLQVRDSVYGLCISKGSSRRVLRFAISIIIISAISGADKLSSSTSSSSRSTLEVKFMSTYIRSRFLVHIFRTPLENAFLL